MVAHGWFVPTDEPDDCKWRDRQKICRVEIDEWKNITSPPADWAKENGEGCEEYRPLRGLRALDG